MPPDSLRSVKAKKLARETTRGDVIQMEMEKYYNFDWSEIILRIFPSVIILNDVKIKAVQSGPDLIGHDVKNIKLKENLQV